MSNDLSLSVSPFVSVLISVGVSSGLLACTHIFPCAASVHTTQQGWRNSAEALLTAYQKAAPRSGGPAPTATGQNDGIAFDRCDVVADITASVNARLLGTAPRCAKGVGGRIERP